MSKYNMIEIKVNRKADNNKIVDSIDVFRDNKWAYTITEEEFRSILVKLSENRLGIANNLTLLSTIAENKSYIDEGGEK